VAGTILGAFATWIFDHRQSLAEEQICRRRFAIADSRAGTSSRYPKFLDANE